MGYFFLVSTHGRPSKRATLATYDEKIYIRLSKIKDRKKQYDFPERISECRLRYGIGRGVGTYDKNLTFFYFTLSSRNDSPNDPTFFSCSHCILYTGGQIGGNRLQGIREMSLIDNFLPFFSLVHNTSSPFCPPTNGLM